MERCRAKRGFFSLRDCGETASLQCATCGRWMCSQHMSPVSGYTRCLDCEGRQAEQQVLKPAKPQPERPLDDPGWSYRYRNRYYGTSGYTPIYVGHYYDSYYDSYDTRSFDSSMASRGPSTADERESGTGLGDS